MRHVHPPLPEICFVDRSGHSDLAAANSGVGGLGASPVQELIDKLFNKKKAKAREEKRAATITNAQAAQQALVEQTVAVQRQSSMSVTKILLIGVAGLAGLIVISELLDGRGGGKRGRRR